MPHDATATDGRVYVADTCGSALFTLATAPHLRVLSRLVLPGTPYGLASDPSRRRLWVTETATNTVAVDTGSGRVFVAGASAGIVQVFDPAHTRSLR